MSYSVLHEKVIPVTMSDGSEGAFGIYDALLHAHEIYDIQCDSLLEQYALLRLLIAFAMDMYQPKSWTDRQELLERGAFEKKKLDEYVALCEEGGPRFDLFDAAHPFMQAAYNEALDQKAMKPANCLSISLPSGNNHVFLDHRTEDTAEMSCSAAFRAMLATYVFCTAGAQGYPSGVNNTPPVFHCIRGDSLFSTIIINMVAQKECAPLDYGGGKVPWRNAEEVIPKKAYAAVSMLEGLTWQPRRITLLQDEDGFVLRVYLQQGKNFKGNDLWKDPHVSYRYGQKIGWSSVKPQAGRALWRDVGTLVADKGGMRFSPPLVIRQAVDLLGDQSALLRIHSLALVTNQASFVEWMEDDLSLPAEFLTDYGMASRLRADVDSVERMQKDLMKAVNAYFSSDSKHSDTLAEEAQLYFLGRMHDIVFGKAVPDLLKRKDALTVEAQAEHMNSFDGWMWDAIQDALRKVVECAGSKANNLLAQENVKRYVKTLFLKYQKEREAAYE